MNTILSVWVGAKEHPIKPEEHTLCTTLLVMLKLKDLDDRIALAYRPLRIDGIRSKRPWRVKTFGVYRNLFERRYATVEAMAEFVQRFCDDPDYWSEYQKDMDETVRA